MTSARGSWRVGAMLLAIALAACNIPADPEGTTERVQGGTLRAGLIAGDEAARRQDAALIERLARRLDARTELVDGEAHDLFAMLDAGALDLVAGGIPPDSPLAAKAALSRAIPPGHETQQRVLVLRAGENRFLAEVNAVIATGARE